jgi:P2 family phage contractile tail tube protein
MTMSVNDILRDYTLFIDGYLFSGDVSSVSMPKLNWKVEEYRGGGMDVPIEVKLGHEKIELEFELTAHSSRVYGIYGLAPGNNKLFKIYAQLVSYDGTEKGVQIEVDGFIKTLDPGQNTPGSKSQTKVTVAADYLKHTIDGTIVLEIDALNKKFVANGVDQNAKARQLLGLGA